MTMQELDLETRIMNYLQGQQWQSLEQLKKHFGMTIDSPLLVALDSLRRKHMVEWKKGKWRMKREDSPEQ